MKTARQIRQELRAEERLRRQLRERAVLALSAAGATAMKVAEGVERNKQALREQLERDLAAEDAKVDAAELAAGRAVVEATSGADLGAIGATFRESELHKRTGIQVAVLRRWMRRVRADEEQASPDVEETPTETRASPEPVSVVPVDPATASSAGGGSQMTVRNGGLV